jgi:hypothetical protein
VILEPFTTRDFNRQFKFSVKVKVYVRDKPGLDPTFDIKVDSLTSIPSITEESSVASNLSLETTGAPPRVPLAHASASLITVTASETTAFK